jgi:hypothetical protein
MKILVFEPGQPGAVRDIDGSLDAMQAVVGGMIEIVPRSRLRLAPGLVAVCNEEGLLLGLPPNRAGLVGTFFLVRESADGELATLTADDLKDHQS